MDENQYIVPPDDMVGDNKPVFSAIPKPVETPAAPTTLGAASSTTPTIPSKPSWIGSHKLLLASLAGAFLIVGLVGTVLLTKQPVSLFGYQLNPLVPHAQVPICDPFDPACGSTGDTSGTNGTSTPNADIPSVLLTAGDSNSSSPNLPSGCDTEVNGPSQTVSIQGSADCLKVTILNPKATYTKDFRICFNLGGTEQCTPWASAGGGATPQIKTNGSFSTAGVRVETQDAPAGKVISGVEVGVQLFYQNSGGPCVQSSGLNWAKAIAGQNVSSPWSYGAQKDDDPGCGLMSLRSQLVDANPVAPISIEGNLPDGVVGNSTSQALNLFGVANTPCSWQVKTFTPQLTGITFTNSDTTGTSSTFKATPDTATTYQVEVKVTCQNNQSVTKTLPWKVTAAPTATLSINGSFPDGTVGTSYSTNVSTINAGTANCTFTITKITPDVPGAKLTKVDNSTSATETSALYSVTPTVAGNYIVSTLVSCPSGTSSPAGTATKDFPWKVVSTPPIEQALVTANCTTAANLPFLTAIYRLWSTEKGDHMYTTSAPEKPAGYRSEGIAGYVYNKSIPGTVAIYRSNQPQIGSHYYSTTNDAAKYGYTDEGILGYAFDSNVAGSATWYRLHKDSVTDYVNTVSEEERSAIKELGYVDEGTVAHLCGTSLPTALQPIFRMWNGAVTEHFYTTNPAERDALLNKGFTSEGITGYMYGVHKDGTSAVYRSYSKKDKHHFFSLTELEATNWGYTVEGIIGYIWASSQPNTIPLYKLYNPKTGDNFYTALKSEVDAAIKVGYQNNGILGYMFLAAQ